MAQTAKAGHEKPLILPPRALQKALADSAERAQRLAKAFNQTVPARPAQSVGRGRISRQP